MPDDELLAPSSQEEPNGQVEDAADEPDFADLDADAKLDAVFADAEDDEGDGKEAQDEAEAEVEPEADVDEDDDEPATGDDAKDAKAYRDIAKAFTDNPKKFIQSMIDALPDDEKAEFLGSKADSASKVKATEKNPLGLEPEELDDGEWTPKSAFEGAAGPIIAKLKDLPAVVDTKIGEIAPSVNHGNLMAEVAIAKVNAVLEALGIQIDDPDPVELHKSLAMGGKTYQDVVMAALGKKAKAAVAAHKQAKKARPATPAPESAGTMGRLKVGMSMAEAMRRSRG